MTGDPSGVAAMRHVLSGVFICQVIMSAVTGYYFSGIHFQVDLAKSSGPHGPVNARASRFASPSRLHHSHSRIVLVQRASSNPHFNIYVDSETPPIELAVPLGRQNCFLAIIYFLLAIEKYDCRGGTRGHTGRTSSLPSALRDLFVDIFGEGDGGDI